MITKNSKLSTYTKLVSGLAFLVFAAIACSGGGSDSEDAAPIGNNSAYPIGGGESGSTGPIPGTVISSSNVGSSGGASSGSSGGFDATVSVDASDVDNDRHWDSYSLTSSRAGSYSIGLTLINVTSFQMVTELDSGILVTDGFYDSEDEVLTSAKDAKKTMAVKVGTFVNSFSYPALEGEDTALKNGTYKQVVNATAGNGDLQGTIMAKYDSDLESGLLGVNVYYVGHEAQTQSAKLAINEALSLFRQIYRKAGISAWGFIEQDLVSDTGILPNPQVGSSFYVRGSGPKYRYVNIFFGTAVSATDSTTPGNVLSAAGVSPSIPGPANATVKSGVAISLLAHQSNNGTYSTTTTRLLGETIAHEVGHYLGLFHPVETLPNSNHYVEGDALSDTPVCSTFEECSAVGLATNFMFPIAKTYLVQEDITAQQKKVMNSQVLVN